MGENRVTVTTRGDLLTGGELAQHPAALYLLNLRSESGRYQMARKLDKVAALLGGEGATWQTFPWGELTAAHVAALVTRLAQDYRPAYVNTILAAVRGVAEQAHDLGQMEAATYRLIRKVKPVAGGNTQPRGRYIPQGELAAMMGECLRDPSPAGRRDAAILACGYPGGLRRAEIASLQREDLADNGETITLQVHGKGRKSRAVYLDNGGADALRDWLTVRGDEPGPLFWAGRRGGHLTRGQGITGQSIYDMLKRRAEAAGIRELGTHDLRRTTASDLLDIADAVTVAGVLGHTSTNTTAKYDRRGERARRKAAQGLHIPYVRRTLGG
jgi:integrase